MSTNLHPLTQVTADNSESVTRSMRKGANKAYAVLAKQFGVNADVYKLKDINHAAKALHGIWDNDNDYEDTPLYTSIKVLIPSLYRRRNAISLVHLDPFIDADTYLYVPDSIEIPIGSLVKCHMPTKKLYNYRVVEQSSVGNDAGWIIHRYSIVPIGSVDTEKNHEELMHLIAEEAERLTSNNQPSESTTESNFNNAKWRVEVFE